MEQLEAAVDRMNVPLGGYPPRFESEEHREKVYSYWCILLANTIAHLRELGSTEAILFLLSELYRQGHNMDVVGAAAKAEEAISQCLSTNSESVPCTFSSAYYYLSIREEDGRNLRIAEENLAFLTGHFAPTEHYDVERNLILLHMQRFDEEAAIAQIDKFLALFPGSPDRSQFEDMRESMRKQEIRTRWY